MLAYVVIDMERFDQKIDVRWLMLKLDADVNYSFLDGIETVGKLRAFHWLDDGEIISDRLMVLTIELDDCFDDLLYDADLNRGVEMFSVG